MRVGSESFRLAVALALLSATAVAGDLSALNPQAGVRFGYLDASCRTVANQAPNRVRVTMVLAQLALEPLDWLTVSLQAGWNMAYATEAVDLASLTPPLRVDRDKFQGVALGLGAAVGPLTSGSFEFLGRLDFVHLNGKRREWPPEPPGEGGGTGVAARWRVITVDGLAVYSGLSGVLPYAGVRLRLLAGRLRGTVREESTSGEQRVDFRQAKALGPLVGVRVDVGDDWEVGVEGSFVSRFGLQATFAYVF